MKKGYIYINGETYMNFKDGTRNCIPHRLFVPALNQTITETGVHPDKFMTFEVRRMKEILGSIYAHVDEDNIKKWVIGARKRKDAGVIKSRNGHGPSKIKPPNEFMEKHYKSSGYNSLKDRIMAKYGHKCQVCYGTAIELHHRDYGHLDMPEEENDVIAVCRKCHKFCDRRRELQSSSPQREQMEFSFS